MATKKQADSSKPWIKSDEIMVDTSKTPWMDFATQELGKKIHEIAADDAFIKSMRTTLTINAQMRAIDQKMARLTTDSPFFGTQSGSMDAGRYRISSKELKDPMPDLLGNMEAKRLQERNPEISKYFQGIKSDPIYDKKARSYEIASAYSSGGYGHVTAWCAAFVDWCLRRAGVPHLGYATARSWLEFGTPVAHPVYGCLTVIKPSSSTGSTTGHVAFFIERQGAFVKLLGGNQGDKVSEVRFKESTVLGYRWPTKINHYLLASAGVLV